MTANRRRILAGAAGMLALPAVGRAQAPRRWRCVTSWSRNLVGPGVTIQRLAKRINEMSQGELVIEVFAAGEIVPAFGVLDAVSNGTVEAGHSASLFWQGKMPAAPFFTTVPFGLSPAVHAGWLDGGGQDLWDGLYDGFGVKPILAGNTGASTAGWFRAPVRTLADFAGLRVRVSGLGGEVYRRIGASPTAIPPGETYPALERGLIDAAELLAPANDAPMGLHRVAPHLGFPGFNKPNGASEFLVSAKVWRDLPSHLKLLVETACRAEHDAGLAEAALLNAAALRKAVAEGALPFRLPEQVLTRLREIAREVLADLDGRDGWARRIHASYAGALEAEKLWQALAR